MVVSIYVEGETSPVARGGRYDHVGETFGRSRPATGFTIDLRRLTQCADGLVVDGVQRKIWAPCLQHDVVLSEEIKSLRQSGDIVVVDLLGEAVDIESNGYTHKLVKEKLSWSVVSLEDKK